MRVNHNKYRLFIYDNHPSSTFQLGDVVTKTTEDGTEIGVIIQTHGDFDFRTNMFGNCGHDEITLSTREEVEKYWPELLPDIDGTSKTISIQGKYINLLEVSTGDLRITINEAGRKMFHQQIGEKLNQHEAFHYILGDVAEHLGLKFCHNAKVLWNKPAITSAHEVKSVNGKLKWARKEDGSGDVWMWGRIINFIKYLFEDGEVIFELKKLKP